MTRSRGPKRASRHWRTRPVVAHTGNPVRWSLILHGLAKSFDQFFAVDRRADKSSRWIASPPSMTVSIRS